MGASGDWYTLWDRKRQMGAANVVYRSEHKTEEMTLWETHRGHTHTNTLARTQCYGSKNRKRGLPAGEEREHGRW